MALFGYTPAEAGPDDDNNIHATVKRLEEKEARHLAHEIIRLYVEVCGGKPFNRR
jgi:hypothetical protein